MKLFNSILMVLAYTGDSRKTPFERRLIKTFGILGRWGAANLQGHDHYTIKHPEKQNQVLIFEKIIELINFSISVQI